MGTEEFWVPAVVAALGGGAQAVNQRNAATRADQAQAQAIRDQAQTQSQGAAAAAKTVRNIASSNPTTIAQKATGDYVSQLRKNAAGSTGPGSTNSGTQEFGSSSSALAPVAGGSSRYNAGKAASQQEVQNYGDTYATEMGNMDAAIRQRQNEGLSMQDLQTNLNTLAQKSWGQNFVDQLRAQTAGTANPWVNLLGSMLQRGASAYATNAAGSKGSDLVSSRYSGGYSPTAATDIISG